MTGVDVTAYWTVAPGRGEMRTERIAAPGDDDVVVRTLASGVSRGTELLVHGHRVPPEVAKDMRAPFQSGDLPNPVKYGYLSVGIVEHGPDHLRGRRVFCLHPHQDRFVVPATAVTVVPDDVPTSRAVLAGTVETAVNALWDGGPRIGDRIAVIGAGMVGTSVALLLRSHPLSRLEVVEASPSRRQQLTELGLCAVAPEAAHDDCDVVFHASASGDGLSRALELLGAEGTVVELSWYGTDQVAVALGSDFHAKRLRIIASQVGRVSESRRSRRSYADRMAVALAALSDAAFDALVSDPAPFHDLPDVMRELASGERDALCQLITYPNPEESHVSPDRP